MKRYQMYIDGKFVDSASKKTFDVYRSGHRGRDRNLPRRQRAGRRPRGRGGQARLLRRLAHHQRPGAGPDPPQDRRPDPRPARRTGQGRDPQLGQADRRIRVRHGRLGRLLRVLRRARHQDQRRGDSGPHQRHGPGGQGTDGRRRADHPLELSPGDGGLEAGPRPRRRLHRRHQARRADAALAAGPGPRLRGGGAPARRREHRDGPRPRCRRAAGGASRRPEDRLHRKRRDRQADHAERVGPAEAGVTRAGRQVAQHLLQRRRFRGRRGWCAVRDLHQPGRGLLGRQPGPGPAGHLQEVRRRLRRQGEDDQARPRHRARDQDGPAGQRRAARPGPQVPGDR